MGKGSHKIEEDATSKFLNNIFYKYILRGSIIFLWLLSLKITKFFKFETKESFGNL